MKNISLNSHGIYNALIRLRSITECITMEGIEFADDEVKQDIKNTLDGLRAEFQILDKETENESN